MASLVFCEDDTMVQTLIQAALRNSGHRVRIASDGEAGLVLIRDERPDVIFTDVSMPLMDGFRLADVLHSRPELAGIPIVFMTASHRPEKIEACYRHGAADLLAKPFTMAELRAKVEAFAGGTRK